jgi:hypothetical protein
MNATTGHIAPGLPTPAVVGAQRRRAGRQRTSARLTMMRSTATSSVTYHSWQL